MDNELLLFDRIEIIKTINEKYDLENNAYISFSGGKDSTILHYLIDMALPNNKIPRVFINTGIEYSHIVSFIKNLALNDNRIKLIAPSQPIKKVLEKYGYPFKSKEHSLYLNTFQNGGTERKTIERYLHPAENRKSFGCPSKLLYQFTKDFNLKVSNKCCLKFKKEPVKKWEKENNRHVVLTGMRSEEGGTRNSLGCVLTDKLGNLKKFHPLIKVNEDWENWFIKEYNIKLCDLYSPPYNFKRTGCKGCPYSLDIQEQLEIMELYLPNEKKQCEIIWEPVYKEYRKLGYRLKKDDGQLSLFDLPTIK